MECHANYPLEFFACPLEQKPRLCSFFPLENKYKWNRKSPFDPSWQEDLLLLFWHLCLYFCIPMQAILVFCYCILATTQTWHDAPHFRMTWQCIQIYEWYMYLGCIHVASTIWMLRLTLSSLGYSAESMVTWSFLIHFWNRLTVNCEDDEWNANIWKCNFSTEKRLDFNHCMLVMEHELGPSIY